MGSTVIFSIVFVPFYIRYLGLESYGLVGFYVSIQAGLILLDLGMRSALSRTASIEVHNKVSQNFCDLLRSIEIISFVIFSCIVMIFILVTDWMAGSWFNLVDLSEDQVALALNFLGLTVGFRFLESIYTAILIGLQRQEWMNICIAVFALMRGLGAIFVLMIVSPSIEMFFLWQAVVGFVLVLTLAVSAYRFLNVSVFAGSFSLLALKSVWKYAAGVTVGTILGVIVVQTDRLLLSTLLTLEEYGYYSLAIIISAPLLTLVAPITQSLFPKLCQLFASDNFDDMAGYFHYGTQLVTIFVGTASIILIVFAEPIISIWLSDAHLAQRISALVQILSIGNLLLAFTRLIGQVAYACNWTSLFVYINAVLVLIIIPSLFLVVPKFGPLGAAYIWVMYNFLALCVSGYLFFSRYLSKEAFPWIFNDILRPLIPACVFAIVIREITSSSDDVVSLVSIIFLSTCCVFVTNICFCNLLRQRSFLLLKKTLTG